jgi:hypothetical protein
MTFSLGWWGKLATNAGECKSRRLPLLMRRKWWRNLLQSLCPSETAGPRPRAAAPIDAGRQLLHNICAQPDHPGTVFPAPPRAHDLHGPGYRKTIGRDADLSRHR